MASTSSGRRRRTAQRGQRTASALSPRVVRPIAAVALALALGLVGWSLYTTVHAARTFGAAYFGMSRDEVRYVFGAPAEQGASGALWRVKDGAAVQSFLFDAKGELDAVGCTGAGACPTVLGVGVGQTEDAIWTAFGAPTSQHYRGEIKVMNYPELGVRFALKRVTIVAVEHRRRRGNLALLGRALRRLLP